MTSMECVDNECNCGDECENQRFQRKEYANIDIIKTDMKGYGMRACSDIRQGTFIYEYIGEVIDEGRFRKRMQQYDEQGIKHFYFMMLQKGEFVDATQKGCLARFCNHSCNPNCFVDKWVVKNKLKMGIFAKRDIVQGEEITFDYNVDRYGAQAQPCYCGEPNCIGFIGGKTQTESASKLPQALADALGLSDGEDDWATVAPKRKRKPKAGEDDEEYVSTLPTRAVKEEGVSKIMSSLLQCKEKWLVSKLLMRIHMSEDQGVQRRVMQMHGYQILGTLLRDWKNENDIIIIVLEILSRWPRMTRNKISSSKIENTVQELSKSEHEQIKNLASELVAAWQSLEMAYRIPRRERPVKVEKKVDATTASNSPAPDTEAKTPVPDKTPKSDKNLKKQQLKRKESKNEHTASPSVPNGPRNSSKPFRPPTSRNDSVRQQPNSGPKLPPNWAAAEDPITKKSYYYNKVDNRTQWDPPTAEEPVVPPAPLATAQSQPEKLDLQKIIDEANKKLAERAKEDDSKREKETKEEKTNGHRRHKEHHNTSKGKKKDVNEVSVEVKLTKTFAKYVPNIVARYEKDVGHERVKKYSKEITKILVEKEMRPGHTVKNLNELSDEKKKKIKTFIKTYMDKIIARKNEKA